MANGHGGYRPGAGRIPRDLHEPIDYRVGKDGEQIPVDAIDRVEEALRTGAFLHDAAARVGITVETLRDWRRRGVKASADVINRRKRLRDVSRRDLQYMELAERMERAEADARVHLLGLANQLARGGIEQTEVTTRTIPAKGDKPQVIEVTERKSRSAPDAATIRWLLSHRWPNDFAGRVELTGPEGAPIQHDTQPALDKLRQLIEETTQNQTQNTPTTPTPTPQPTPNGHNTTPTP